MSNLTSYGSLLKSALVRGLQCFVTGTNMNYSAIVRHHKNTKSLKKTHFTSQYRHLTARNTKTVLTANFREWFDSQ